MNVIPYDRTNGVFSKEKISPEFGLKWKKLSQEEGKIAFSWLGGGKSCANVFGQTEFLLKRKSSSNRLLIKGKCPVAWHTLFVLIYTIQAFLLTAPYTPR